jgi:hypothetical protein
MPRKRIQGEIVNLNARYYEYDGLRPHPRSDADPEETLIGVHGKLKLVRWSFWTEGRREDWLVLEHDLSFGWPEKGWRETVVRPDKIVFTGRVSKPARKFFTKRSEAYRVELADKRRGLTDRIDW